MLRYELQNSADPKRSPFGGVSLVPQPLKMIHITTSNVRFIGPRPSSPAAAHGTDQHVLSLYLPLVPNGDSEC